MKYPETFKHPKPWWNLSPSKPGGREPGEDSPGPKPPEHHLTPDHLTPDLLIPDLLTSPTAAYSPRSSYCSGLSGQTAASRAEAVPAAKSKGQKKAAAKQRKAIAAAAQARSRSPLELARISPSAPLISLDLRRPGRQRRCGLLQ